MFFDAIGIDADALEFAQFLQAAPMRPVVETDASRMSHFLNS